MDQGTQTFRTVADFGAVPPGELPNCLRAFQTWLREQTEAGEAARPKLAEGFVWNPVVPKVHPTTPIRELGLRASAVSKFMQMNIYALEDFSEVSLREMTRQVNVGDTTVRRIQAMLKSVGLDFRTTDAPAFARPAAATAPRDAGVAFSDETLLSTLRLRSQTVKMLLLRNVRTVGDLRSQTPAFLSKHYSQARRYEIFSVLRSRNLNLHSNPSELELWQAGLVHLNDLHKPGDGDGVEQLRPWLGSTLVKSVVAAQFTTIGQLRARAATGAVQSLSTGISPYSWVRIRRFFGMSRLDTLDAQEVS